MGTIWQKAVSFSQRLKEISRFFERKDEVYKTLGRVVRRLEKAGIPYAVLGGMAVNAHGYRRTTGDVDLLLTKEGFEEFRKKFIPKNYGNVGQRPRWFTDNVNQIAVDILVTGRFPGTGAPGPVSFPDPEKVSEEIENFQVVNLLTLVELKLAARRYQDFADVVYLIRANNLDESFKAKLNPAVHRDYIECLEEKRREDEYEERQDQQE